MAQELTFNISEDRRKLQGPVEAKNFNLKFGTDGVAITHGNPKQWVQGRIGDNELKQVFVNITEGENNTPKDVAGLFLAFVGIIHDKDGRPHRVVDYKHSTTIDVEHGRFRFDFPDQAFTVAGEYQQAFFMLVKEGPGGGCVATMEFDMQVMANFVFTDLVPEDYITPFNDTVDQLLAACKKFKDDTAADEAKFKQELEDAYAKFKKANADDIAKFKQQYADAVQAKEDELQSKVDSYTDKVDTLLKDLNQQGIDTTTLLTTLQANIKSLEDKIKQDGLFTSAEADQFKQSLDDKMEKLKETVTASLQSRGLNVKDFGAVGDGTTDNAEAIQKAYDAAKSKGINRIYFPSGRYFTTTTNLLIKNMVVSGQGPYESVLISDRAEPIFDVKTYGSVLDLGFEDTCDNPSIALAVQNTDSTPSYWGIRFERLHFKGREIINNQTGVWTYQPIKLDLNNKGLWDITVDDVNIEWTKTGVCVDMTNGGWLTGSIFNNITIKGFSEYAFGLVSSNNTARQCSQNVFSNLDAEVLYKTATNAVGYVVSGTGNDFNNLRLFNDGAYSGKAIQLRYFGGDMHDQKAPNFNYGATANNRFAGGTVEGTIDDPDGIRDLQSFKGLRLQIVDENGRVEQVNVENPKATNLISNEELSRSLDYRSPIQLSKGTKISSGYDEYGKYIDYSTGENGDFFGVSLIRPDQVASVISTADRFSVGIKYREIDGTNPISLGTIRFKEIEFGSQNLRYQFTNPGKGSLKQKAWIYNNDNNYWKNIIGSASRFDALWFHIGPNARVRIYDTYLVSQQAVDFDKVSNRNTVRLDERGCRNYVKNSNQILSASNPVTNLAPQTIPFEIDVDGINWQTRRSITLSFDVNVDNLDCSNVTSRLALYFEVDITFDDQSVMSYNVGVPTQNADVILDRYFATYTLPNKKIAKASANVGTTSGLTCSFFQIGRPQLERGSVGHDYIPYIADKGGVTIV